MFVHWLLRIRTLFKYYQWYIVYYKYLGHNLSTDFNALLQTALKEDSLLVKSISY